LWLDKPYYLDLDVMHIISRLPKGKEDACDVILEKDSNAGEIHNRYVTSHGSRGTIMFVIDTKFFSICHLVDSL
jgi:hypothetical protein